MVMRSGDPETVAEPQIDHDRHGFSLAASLKFVTDNYAQYWDSSASSCTQLFAWHTMHFRLF